MQNQEAIERANQEVLKQEANADAVATKMMYVALGVLGFCVLISVIGLKPLINFLNMPVTAIFGG